MPFTILMVGVFIIKGVFLWIFYTRQGWQPLLVGLVSGIGCYSLMTLLYHETSVDFWMVLFLIMIFDGVIYNLLIKKNIVKSIIVSFLLNIIAIVFFLFANG